MFCSTNGATDAVDAARGRAEGDLAGLYNDGGGVMERGLLVELSPNEESALQRIAFGFDQTGLRLDYLTRLKVLALVEVRDRALVLTALGARRVATLRDSAPRPK